MGHMQSSTLLDSILRFSGFATMSASRMGDTLVRCDLTGPGKLFVTLLLNIMLRLERLPPVGLIAVTRATTICRPR